MRVFPIPARRTGADSARRDFRDTVLWAPSVTTDAAGRAQVRFVLSDAVTSFRAFAEGVGVDGAGAGLLGRSETVIASSLPFSMAVKLPQAVTSRDALRVPLTLTNEGDQRLTVTVKADLGKLLELDQAADATRDVSIEPHARQTIFYAARPRVGRGQSEVSFTATAAGLSDSFAQKLPVEPAGFPQELTQSGTLAADARHDVNLGEALPGTIEAVVRLYPSPVATMLGGLEGILQEPGGCFEQASSSNYPNVMVMNYLERHEVDDAALLTRSKGLLERGYARLAGYETKSKGYEWFGQSPGHEALTAYGLMEFHDMQAVFPGVSDAMVKRTAEWLLTRRDGRGGFKMNPEALDSFGRASPEVTNAYITWSLVEAGVTSLEPELALQSREAESTKDAYRLALAANALMGVADTRAAGVAATARLIGMQDEDGAWSKADHSITRSSGENLSIETTSLAVLALLREGQHPAEADKAVAWLEKHRGGFGSFGTTQATVLALKALTAYAESRRATQSAGKVDVSIDGDKVGELTWEAGHQGALELALTGELGARLADGTHTIALRHEGGEPMPYTLAVTYRTLKPATASDAVVSVETALDKREVAMGEAVRLTATVTNTTTSGQPMALARIGIPGGLSFQTWQLKELVDKGQVAFFETGPREVVLYFRDLAPSVAKTIPLDLLATVPGSYKAAASSAYLYYTNDKKVWADGVSIAVKE
ncbi:MAG: alpha-2-macroglobulin family protein [Myxococcota bacterium]